MEFLDREHSVAKPGYTRWLVPPAALAVHLCIGEIYGFSVFNVPLTRLLGVTQSAPGDWTIPQVSWLYSTGLILLGLSAAFFGKWVEKNGPRKTMFVSACCWGGGFLVASLGVKLHQFWLVLLGYGILGGIGLGLGYISPVSTLVKWFPDRPGMATGMAIMGFGGGALIGAPFGSELLKHFATPQSTGVAGAFLVMGVVYFGFMVFGSMTVRVPPPDWKPAGFVPSTVEQKLVTTANVTADAAIKTPQFWLLWAVLCLNVTAGIGILGQASNMCQNMFAVPKAVGDGFAGFLSIFNMGGRFFWSSTSDYTGRKRVYFIYFLLGTLLYCLIPLTQRLDNVALFVVVTALIISMYGGGFATIPAYLRDMFGTMQVGAIHGRLITAWSMAAILGPQLITCLAEFQKSRRVPVAQSYNITMYLMAALLLIGACCNALIRAVDRRHHCQGGQTGASPNPSKPA